ncbi:archease [Sediminicola sp. 1XM1-17]|uniref:archease n=1 Tax=Sediminicola sp. 1XM1-17 TaxID=3127702 RepID=UPI003077A9B4
MMFEFHPHTADIRMRVEAPTLVKIYEAALLGMAEILKEGLCKDESNFDLESTIEIESKDNTCLLIDFLSEVLAHSYAEKAVYCRLEIQELQDNKLKVTLFGKHIDSLDEEIKAVTYHEALLIKNNNDQWETFIIFDI